ncbi:MAG: glycosyltransferase family 2 protein [Polaribacter sp.]|jgi:glycosyltransferase involved in cell wall biosynthesis|nr:glycosyltransferase family 2 protein [Polaribacter sp.]MDC1104058.1 glycosyltransferase family 2 protein [Polaribacter sp.]MDC1375317.1 glycosyltransferase family 2 protein [Polaribacter sp.]MDG1245245.1 glycosyltransferase family 2 protein [Polaribacter sp.]MDG1320736.1 glycosyltransferase family 2 protein [Polaribacter sp.]
MQAIVKVIIPAYNEQDSIANVVNDIPKIVDEIIVISNNSTDNTPINAKNAGATVLHENKKGYGYACLKGLNYIENQKIKPEIVVFLDGDYSDYPAQLTELIAPIITKNIDFVLGARVKEQRESGAMTPQQIFGNWLATALMKLFFGATYTDLGPFRAIKYEKLMALKMEDKTYGWTVEMQLKVLKQQFTYLEIPVKYRNRIGVSKVSGTIKGAIFAGIKILTWIFKYSLKK